MKIFVYTPPGSTLMGNGCVVSTAGLGAEARSVILHAGVSEYV